MSQKYIIGIIGAMDVEIAELTRAMDPVREQQKHGLTFYVGTLASQQAIVVKCGMGKVNAARTAQILIDEFAVTHIINTGIAGGLSPLLRVGDAVVATALVEHDFDLTIFGYAKGYLQVGEKDKPSQFPADPDLSAAIADAAVGILGENHVHRGIIATGDQFIADRAQKERLLHEFHATAAEMEGGAIAHTAYLSGVPFCVVRTVSDLADGTAAASYDAFETAAAHSSANIVKQTLLTLDCR